ncbi:MULTISPECIES: hypothetical protein [Lysobacter]|jgi:hypothetical protein|uniref:hypothetical protein n=1 Tax=Lysobacter TaxID=68 RepID=UPI001F344F92|nr:MULTISPECIES: hypothetical protein [Lysobacter]UJB19191.1 hypothetical protein L1A79_23245 [Lysobacter capsici]UJQ27084.1 hypothetical protein L2D09_16640 [Lysobacter gummosus]
MQTLVIAFNVLSCASAYLAAFLWFKSAVAKVPHVEGNGGTGNPEIIVDGYRFIESAKLQAIWNRRAALAAGFAAIFQGCSLLLGLTGAT